MKEEFWAIPKSIFAKKEISIEARILYSILFTRANGENVAWPGQKYLADIMGVGKRSVQRYLDELKKHGLIETRREGLHRTNRYFLIGQVGASKGDKSVASKGDTAVSHPIVREETEEKSSKTLAAPSAADSEKEVNKRIAEIIHAFKPVKPFIQRLYTQPPQRQAAKEIIDEFGFEKALKVAEYAVSVQGQPFAPVITTPYQLREKVGNLKIYATSEKNKKQKLWSTL